MGRDGRSKIDKQSIDEWVAGIRGTVLQVTKGYCARRGRTEWGTNVCVVWYANRYKEYCTGGKWCV